MAKKKKTIYLLVLVILIYGTIAVRFLLWDDSPEVVGMLSSAQNTSFQASPVQNIKSFAIANDYRDPFLGTISIKNRSATKSTTTPRRSQSETKIKWPSVLYKGLVSDSKNGTKVFAVSINNEEYIIRKGQQVREITLIKGNKEQIIITYQGAQKTVQQQ